jgi:hypothetical protein
MDGHYPAVRRAPPERSSVGAVPSPGRRRLHLQQHRSSGHISMSDHAADESLESERPPSKCPCVSCFVVDKSTRYNFLVTSATVDARLDLL